MDNRQKFLYCRESFEDGVTQQGAGARGWKSASKAVGCHGGKSPWQGREPIDSRFLREEANSSVLHCREKLLTRRTAPVPKPTQVGGERILRCAGKPSLRNSANCIRNLGRRMTLSKRKGETPGTEQGGRKEAQATVYQKHRCLRKRKLKYRC